MEHDPETRVLFTQLPSGQSGLTAGYYHASDTAPPSLDIVRLENRSQVRRIESALNPRLDRTDIRAKNALTIGIGYKTEAFLQKASQYFRLTFRLTFRLVVDFLVAMGYGGTEEDAASVVGRSGDGGIDGIIKEDRLGLDNIYVQAKRWTPSRTVGSPDVPHFAGALPEHRARKGVFITTSSFSKDAIDSAKASQMTIVLIDGNRLAQLMLDYGVGVSVQETIRLLKVDEDYFEEDT